MGHRPTLRNESQDVTPAKAGVHVKEELDSGFRGNDATFDWFLLNRQSTIENRQSFVPERHDGIDLGGPARGNVAGQKRCKAEQQGDTGKSERISRTHPEQQ